MIVNTKSWHYKVYSGTYTAFGDSVPWNTNLCQYVRRTFFLSWFWYAFAVLVRAFFFGVLTPLAVLIGKVPERGFRYTQLVPGWNFRDYDGWKIGSIELFPWMVLAPLVFFGLNTLWITSVCNYGIHAVLSCAFLMFECILLFIALHFLFFEGMFDETRNVTGAWLSAKKQKICPLIEFSDKLPTDREP